MNRFNFTCPFCEVPQQMFTHYGGSGKDIYTFPEVPNDILQELIDNHINCANCSHAIILDQEKAVTGTLELTYTEKEYIR